MSQAAGVQASQDLDRVNRLFSGDHARWWRELYVGPEKSLEARFFRQRRDIACMQLAQRVSQDGPVLDLGCGSAPVLARLRRWGWRCIGLDGSPEMLAQARHRLAVQGLHDADLHLGDARRLPFADGAFAAVVCLGVISYVQDPRAVLAEIHRVLQPGGIALVSCRSDSAPRIWDPWRGMRHAIGRIWRGLRRKAAPSIPFTPGRFMSPQEVQRDLQAHGLTVLQDIGIGYGPPRWAGRPWLPASAALWLDGVLSRWAARGWGERTLREAADIRLWVVQRDGRPVSPSA